MPWGQVLLSEARTTNPNCMQEKTKNSPTNHRASKAESFEGPEALAPWGQSLLLEAKKTDPNRTQEEAKNS